MTDHTRTTLDRLMDEVPIGPAPIDTLLMAGRSAKRRKRRALIGGAAVVAAVVMGGSGLAVQSVTGTGMRDGGVADDPSPVAPSIDTHLVGVGQAVVAVPADWGANEASCNTPVRDTYFFPYPQDCISSSHPTVSSVAITTGAFTETGTHLRGLIDDGTIAGHQVVASKASCSPGQGEYCRQVFGIPDLNAYFTVTIPASDDGLSTIAAIRDSLTVLPDEQTTIPYTFYPVARHNSQAVTVRALQAAGFSVEVKGETCPPNAGCLFGVTGVHPEVGTVAPVGSTVTVTVLEE